MYAIICPAMCNVKLSSGIWLLGFISKFKACILVGVVLVTCSAHRFFCFQNGDSIVHRQSHQCLQMKVSIWLPSTTAVSVLTTAYPFPYCLIPSHKLLRQPGEQRLRVFLLLFLFLPLLCFSSLKVLSSFKFPLGVLISSCSSVSSALSSSGKNR